MTDFNALLHNPALHDYLAIVKGARNGFVYGVKVRFPHALVMAILFGRGDWKARCRFIYQTTQQHAFVLAKFAALYKTLLLLLRKVNGGKERSADTFIAGLIGGYVVIGKRTPVNEQIALYVISRVIAAFLPRAKPSQSGSTPARPTLPPDARYFAVFVALGMGAVMWLFKNRSQSIQPGMFSSLTYIYRDSEVWKDLRTLFWHNT